MEHMGSIRGCENSHPPPPPSFGAHVPNIGVARVTGPPWNTWALWEDARICKRLRGTLPRTCTCVNLNLNLNLNRCKYFTLESATHDRGGGGRRRGGGGGGAGVTSGARGGKFNSRFGAAALTWQHVSDAQKIKKKFSKVSALAYILYKITIRRTFQEKKTQIPGPHKRIHASYSSHVSPSSHVSSSTHRTS
jgi:hypothetical protein